MNKITSGKTPIERITYLNDAPPPIRFAAEELQTYLRESLNVEIDVEKGVPAKGVFFISTSELNPEVAADVGQFEEGKYDRCIVACRDDCVFLIGENPISALYAVYDFLQDRLNIRFFAPGREHEYIPKHSAIHLENGFVLQTGSRFVIRDYVTNNPETLSFAVKNRVNTIKWEGLNCDAKDLETIRARGVKLRGPGHCWNLFVPDESLFNEHPEYFPMLNGRRAVNHRTACFSNPEVRKMFLQKLRNYLRENPYWDIFAFWAEDIKDPYYCGCPECANMEIPDWYITLVNEAANVVEEELPHAAFEFIAYHGTRFTPKQVKALRRLLDSIQPPQGNDQLAHRLKLIRIHHEYCMLLKEIFQAFIDNAPAKWQALEKPYMTFFEETHRSDLEGHIDIPPSWAYTWFTLKLKKGKHLRMTKDLMLH